MAIEGRVSTTIGALLKRDGGSVKTGPFGTTLKAKEYSKEGVPLISVGEVGYGSLRVHESTPRAPREVVERLPEYLLEAGDIVFGRKGAVDRSAMVKAEQAGWFLGSDGIRLRLPSTCDARFIAYQLQSSGTRSWLLQHATGTTMASLNQGTIEGVPIALPPFPEQRAIAHILGTLDDKIELNRRTNETLETIARALFKSWFVDFDPVRAKSEGRDPCLPKHLADLFPDSFQDSELGEIPNGWKVMAIGDLADVNARILDRTDRLEVIDYVEISEVMRGQVANVVRYERGTEPSRARRRLVHGDTVLSTVRPDRGSYFLSLSPPETLIASTGFAVASPHDGNWAFLYSALTRPEVGDEMGRLADGGAYPAVRPEAVTGFRLVSPQMGETRTAYDELARPLYERSEHNRIENRTLAGLRGALLPKIISGELRVKAVGRLVDAAVAK